MRILSGDIITQSKGSHIVALGKTGSGKSGFQRIVARAVAANPSEGMTFVDKHGEAVRDTAAWIANPENHIRRDVHVLTPGSDYSFSLNPFQTDRDHPDEWHDAARQWASIVSSSFHAQPGQLPLLERLQHVAGFVAAEKKLTLLDFPALFSLGGDYLRERVIAECSNSIVAGEWRDLHEMATRHPRMFLDVVSSSRNRILQWLTSRPLMRIYGRHKGLDARKIMDERHIVLIDLSTLSDIDASFVGKCINSTYLTAAKRRVPHGSDCHRLVIDEAESMLCLETARLLDQTRKYNLLLCCNLQRLAQLRERDDGEFIFDAVMSNCAVKIVFAMPEVESARYCAELLFTGCIDLQEWKEASIRPVAVGNEKVIVRGKSRAAHEAHSRSHADIDSRSWARASAAMSASMVASGTATGVGSSLSFASTPPEPVFGSPIAVSRNDGRSTAANSSRSSARSDALSQSRQYARGHARADAHADMRGSSEASNETEAYITKYQELPTQMYSLEEQLHRVTGSVMTLPNRECFVKVDGHSPVRARTSDLAQAFRSPEFKQEWLPRFLNTAARRSPFLVSTEIVDAEIRARFDASTQSEPEADIDFAAREPMPVIDAPEDYAHDFARRRGQSARPTLRIVDGGKDGDNSSNA
jgi:hypothetical protein